MCDPYHNPRCVAPETRLVQRSLQGFQRRFPFIAAARIARQAAKERFDAVCTGAEGGRNNPVPFDCEVSKADNSRYPIDAFSCELVDKGFAAFDETVDLVVHA